MSKNTRRRLDAHRCFSLDSLERRVLLSGGQLFVANDGNGTIGEYTTSGATVNASLISGLNSPQGIAVSGSDLFVVDESGGIGQYTTSGATMNAFLLTGLDTPVGIAVSGSYMFVPQYPGAGLNGLGGTVGEYTTGGQNVDASLVSGLWGGPAGIAISGSDMFVVNSNNGTVGEYTTTGATVNASLLSGFESPQGIAVSGSDLFVTDYFAGTIGEYTTSGATVNADLISGVSSLGIAVSGSDLFVTGYDNGNYVIGEYTTSGATVNAALISGLSDPDAIAVTTGASTLDQLAFDQQPASATTTGTLGPITVDVEDANGNLLGGDNSSVTLALAAGSGGATLGGTTTVAAVNGVATFSNVSVATVGDNYTLTATDGALASATSMPFNITVAAAQSSVVPTLGNVTLPPAVVAGAKLKAKVPVVITNQGSGSIGDITVNIYADTGTTLDGNQVLVTSLAKSLSLTAGKGKVVNFSIKSLPPALNDGTYHLLAEVVDGSGLTNVTATTETVRVAAAFIQPAVTLGAAIPASIPAGKSGSIMLTIANNGNVAAAGVDITLSPSMDGITPVAGVLLETVRSGGKIQPGKSKTFKLHFKATSALAAGSYFPYVAVSLGGVSITDMGTAQFTVG